MQEPNVLLKTLRHGTQSEAEQAARTLKHIAQADRTALHSHRKALLREALRATDVRVQWNLTIVLGRLPLTGSDKAAAVDLMFERLADAGGLNRTFALQALVDLSENDSVLRARVLPILREALDTGTPAMRARAKRLLKQSG